MIGIKDHLAKQLPDIGARLQEQSEALTGDSTTTATRVALIQARGLATHLERLSGELRYIRSK